LSSSSTRVRNRLQVTKNCRSESASRPNRDVGVACHQDSGEVEALSSEWIGVTTLTTSLVPTASVVRWGHARWDIENHGFNELVNGWHADHVYKHEPNAIEAFLLSAFLAYNLSVIACGTGILPVASRSSLETSMALPLPFTGWKPVLRSGSEKSMY